MTGSFEIDLKRFAQKGATNMRTVVRKVSLELLGKVVLRTPVGNPSLWKSPPPRGYVGGTARGNWQAAVGTVPTGELERTDEGGGATIRAGESMIMAWDAESVLFVVNNVPYIIPLETGHSTQAPEGMLVVSIREFPYIVEREASEVR